MPEIPDLEAYAAYFNKRVPGRRIEAAERGPVPWLIRAPAADWEERSPAFKPVYRYAKMLFPLKAAITVVTLCLRSLPVCGTESQSPIEEVDLTLDDECRFATSTSAAWATYVACEDEFAGSAVDEWALT
jgi:hypothetical protein